MKRKKKKRGKHGGKKQWNEEACELEQKGLEKDDTK